MTTLLDRRTRAGTLVAAVLIAASSACGDAPTGGLSATDGLRSRIDGVPLDRARLDAAREWSQGCAFIAADEAQRVARVIRRPSELPFQLPRIAAGSVVAERAHEVHLELRHAELGTRIRVSCIAPVGFSSDELVASVGASIGAVGWEGILAELALAPRVELEAPRELSPEVREAAYEMVGRAALGPTVRPLLDCNGGGGPGGGEQPTGTPQPSAGLSLSLGGCPQLLDPMVVWGVSDSFWTWVDWTGILATLESVGGPGYYDTVSWLLDPLPYGGGGGAPPGGTGGGGPGDPANWQWPDCNPQTDPDCHKPLTAQDSITIVQALENHLRPANQFTDEMSRRHCEAFLYTAQQMLANSRVFRGSFVTISPDSAHYGLYDPSTMTMHIEPDLLDLANGGSDSARIQVAATMLHEAAHAEKMQHEGFQGMPSVWGPLYNAYPWTILQPDANSCLLYS